MPTHFSTAQKSSSEGGAADGSDWSGEGNCHKLAGGLWGKPGDGGEYDYYQFGQMVENVDERTEQLKVKQDDGLR